MSNQKTSNSSNKKKQENSVSTEWKQEISQEKSRNSIIKIPKKHKLKGNCKKQQVLFQQKEVERTERALT